MVSPPQFASLEAMESSAWLKDIKAKMAKDQWPSECVRCQETEPQSVRIYSLQLHEKTPVSNYLQVAGVLDNVCNAACLSCNENLSTRIGSLKGRTFPIVDNSSQFRELPYDRIVHLDINGGEPSYSKNYKYLLRNLPPNLRTLRLNTNCSSVLTNLVDLVLKQIQVTVTVSCDGIGPMHELLRWPIPWKQFYDNLMIYKSMPVKLNLWTTVSILNVDDLPNIQAFAQEHGIDHSFAYLKEPFELSVENKNLGIREAYIRQQKELRGIQ